MSNRRFWFLHLLTAFFVSHSTFAGGLVPRWREALIRASQSLFRPCPENSAALCLFDRRDPELFPRSRIPRMLASVRATLEDPWGTGLNEKAFDRIPLSNGEVGFFSISDCDQTMQVVLSPRGGRAYRTMEIRPGYAPPNTLYREVLRIPLKGYEQVLERALELVRGEEFRPEFRMHPQGIQVRVMSEGKLLEKWVPTGTELERANRFLIQVGPTAYGAFGRAASLLNCYATVELVGMKDASMKGGEK